MTTLRLILEMIALSAENRKVGTGNKPVPT